MIITIKLINVPFTSHNYPFLYVCGENTYNVLSAYFKCTSAQVLLTIVTMLDI